MKSPPPVAIWLKLPPKVSASILMIEAGEWHMATEHSTPQGFGHPTDVPATAPTVFGEGAKERSLGLHVNIHRTRKGLANQLWLPFHVQYSFFGP